MKVTLLGTGGSSGVPFIGCDCEICRSNNSKNKRLRVSAYIEIPASAGMTKDIKLLIDTSPDFRQQALTNDIRHIDAVLFTHDHADHVHGIDDLRSFNYLAGDALPIFSNEATISVLKTRFPYVFKPKPAIWSRPCLIPHVVPDAPVHHFDVLGQAVTAFAQGHGMATSLGYRIGNFAYSTDVDRFDEAAFEALKNLDVWVVDCLRYRPSPTHSHLERTLGWIERVKPKLAILTHMTHDIDYQKLSTELPAGAVAGYDGMVIEL